MGTRVAVYARISDDRTGEAAGVDRQEHDATEQARRRGWEVVATLVDNDISASRYAKRSRPAYRKLLEMIETGQVDAISVWHTDRLYRQPKELEHLIDLVEQQGILVATCEGELDLGTSDGRVMARVVVAMAAKESDDKSRRIRRMHQSLAAQGKPHGGGKRPFGYEADRVTVRESEAALIRDACARVVAGESLRSIVKRWVDDGVETVTGAPWQVTTLRRMLMSPRLVGKRTHRGSLVDAVWPALIDEPTHTRVTHILKDPTRDQVAGVAARRGLLSGFLHCGGCGTRMVSHRGRYECSRDKGGCGSCGIAGRLDRDVTDAVLALVSDEKVRRAVRDRADDGEEAALLDGIAALEAEVALIAQDYAEGRIGRDGYLAAVAALEERLVDHRRSLSRRRSTATVVELIATDATSTWEEMGLDRQRAAIGQLIDRIDITPSYRRAGVYDFTRAAITWR